MHPGYICANWHRLDTVGIQNPDMSKCWVVDIWLVFEWLGLQIVWYLSCIHHSNNRLFVLISMVGTTAAILSKPCLNQIKWPLFCQNVCFLNGTAIYNPILKILDFECFQILNRLISKLHCTVFYFAPIATRTFCQPQQLPSYFEELVNLKFFIDSFIEFVPQLKQLSPFAAFNFIPIFFWTSRPLTAAGKPGARKWYFICLHVNLEYFQVLQSNLDQCWVVYICCFQLCMQRKMAIPV